MAFATAAAIIGIGAAVVGTGLSVYGASEAADANQEIARQEAAAEAVRKQAMQLDAQRKTFEVIRNRQKARAISLTRATAQNAQGGSGLQGGYGQISGATGYNLWGINAGLTTGSQLFDINAAISQQKMALADANSMMQMGSSITSLGGAFIGNIDKISALGKTFAGSSGGSPSYYQSVGDYQMPVYA